MFERCSPKSRPASAAVLEPSRTVRITSSCWRRLNLAGRPTFTPRSRAAASIKCCCDIRLPFARKTQQSFATSCATYFQTNRAERPFCQRATVTTLFSRQDDPQRFPCLHDGATQAIEEAAENQFYQEIATANTENGNCPADGVGLLGRIAANALQAENFRFCRLWEIARGVNPGGSP